MKYQILVFCLLSSVYQNCDDTDWAMNLVIFNDVNEFDETLAYATPWDIEERSETKGAVARALLDTLMSNANPVLCTKASWLLVQILDSVWNQYLVLSSDELLKLHTELFSTAEKLQFNLFKKRDFKNKIELYQKYIQNLEKKYQAIPILKLDFRWQRADKAKELKNDMKKLLDQIKSEESDDAQFIMPINLFCIHMVYMLICKYGYECREVNSDFILFVPEAKCFKNAGLNYSRLLMYSYDIMPNHYKQIWISLFALQHHMNNSLGKSLLDALKKLCINSQDVIGGKIQKIEIDLNKAETMLQYVNILIVGHGNLDSMTAEISVTKSELEPVSDFEQILDFFNKAIQLKTLTIVSCFPGGSKLLNTFDLTNQFSNTLLDTITYPIINVGLFANVVVSQLKTIMDSVFVKYFDFLNQKLPDYQSAFKVISGVFQEDQDLIYNISNFINIKFPHTAWYTPAEFKNLTQTISQIKASTQKSIKINQSTQVVLMGANMVSEIVISSDTSIPLFLPSNYHNQNYVVEHMNASGIQLSIHDCMKSLLPLPTIEEPINFVIKKLTLGTGVYTNVCTFTDYESANISYPICGYLYTDQKNQTIMVSWPNFDQRPEEPLEKPFKAADAQSIIKKIEMQARKGFDEKYPSLAKDALTKLSETIQKKQVQAPQVVQANVIQKYEKKGEKWIQKIAKDVEDVAQEVARV